MQSPRRAKEIVNHVKEKRGNSGRAGSPETSNSGAAASNAGVEPANVETMSKEEASKYLPPGWRIDRDDERQNGRRCARREINRTYREHGQHTEEVLRAWPW